MRSRRPEHHGCSGGMPEKNRAFRIDAGDGRKLGDGAGQIVEGFGPAATHPDASIFKIGCQKAPTGEIESYRLGGVGSPMVFPETAMNQYHEAP